MKLSLYILVGLLSGCFLKAQVNFTNANTASVNTADQIMVYINNASESSNIKGFGLPAVDTLVDLPLTGTSAPSSRIEVLRGMLMFVKSTNEAMVFDGMVWSKAFEVEADNISRFRINTISTTSGAVLLPINNEIDKTKYLVDPLKLKTNVPIIGADVNRLYIRQTGLYRVNVGLNLTNGSGSVFSSRLGATMYVNDVKRFQLLETIADFDTNNNKVNLDFTVYAKQGEYLTLETLSEIGGTASFTVSPASFVTVEKIL